MIEERAPADPAIVLDLLEAFRRSKTMFAAVELGVFDALESRPQPLAKLAETLGCNADALERLLDACVGLSLLSKANGNYANTPVASTYLYQGSPRRMTGYISYSNHVMWKLWEVLEDAVREGTHRWRQVYGWDGPIFSHFFRTEEATREFSMGMHGFGLISSPHVVRAFDLSGHRRFVDLGGATGHLAIAACRQYPQLRGVVFDLPEVVPLAREMVKEAGMSGRIDVVAGDFFVDPLPEGDIYALGRIVHDWDPAKIARLLLKICTSLPEGGSLLIAEKMLLDDKSGPRWAQMQSLNMLTCTEGKERTLFEYTTLLKQAGFGEVQGRQTASPLDAVLARKPLPKGGT